jgi:hypothetical protein
MARSQPVELQGLDALVAAAATIGVAAPTVDWFTKPKVTEGIPLDFQSLPKTPKEQIYIQYIGSVLNPDADAMPAKHGTRARYAAWLVIRADVSEAGYRRLIQLRSDFLRAVFAAEGTLQTIFSYGMWPGAFTPREEMLLLENWVGVQELMADFGMTHANP